MPSGGPATGRNASAKGNKSCFQTVRDRDKFRDVMSTGFSSILAAAERQQPSRFVHARATSPLKTRVQGFRQSPPGRLSQRGRRRREIATGSRGCCYKTASGRSEWLSRDPISERGGINLYAYVGGDPIDRCDVSGLNVYLFREIYGGSGHATLIVDNPAGGILAYGFNSLSWSQYGVEGAAMAFFFDQSWISKNYYDSIEDYVNHQSLDGHQLELSKLALGTDYDDEFMIDLMKDIAHHPPPYSILAGKTCYQRGSEWFWDYLGTHTTEYPVEWLPPLP